MAFLEKLAVDCSYSLLQAEPGYMPMNYEKLIRVSAESDIRIKSFFNEKTPEELFAFFKKHPSKFNVYDSGLISMKKSGVLFTTRDRSSKTTVCTNVLRYLIICLKHLEKCHYLDLINYVENSLPKIRHYFWFLTSREKEAFIKTHKVYFDMKNDIASLKPYANIFSIPIFTTNGVTKWSEILALCAVFYLRSIGNMHVDTLANYMVEFACIESEQYLNTINVIAFLKKNSFNYFNVDDHGVVSIETDVPRRIMFSAPGKCDVIAKIKKGFLLYLLFNGPTHFQVLLAKLSFIKLIKTHFSRKSDTDKEKFFQLLHPHFEFNNGIVSLPVPYEKDKTITPADGISAVNTSEFAPVSVLSQILCLLSNHTKMHFETLCNSSVVLNQYFKSLSKFSKLLFFLQRPEQFCLIDVFYVSKVPVTKIYSVYSSKIALNREENVKDYKLNSSSILDPNTSIQICNFSLSGNKVTGSDHTKSPKQSDVSDSKKINDVKKACQSVNGKPGQCAPSTNENTSTTDMNELKIHKKCSKTTVNSSVLSEPPSTVPISNFTLSDKKTIQLNLAESPNPTKASKGKGKKSSKSKNKKGAKKARQSVNGQPTPSANEKTAWKLKTAANSVKYHKGDFGAPVCSNGSVDDVTISEEDVSRDKKLQDNVASFKSALLDSMTSQHALDSEELNRARSHSEIHVLDFLVSIFRLYSGLMQQLNLNSLKSYVGLTSNKFKYVFAPYRVTHEIEHLLNNSGFFTLEKNRYIVPCRTTGGLWKYNEFLGTSDKSDIHMTSVLKDRPLQYEEVIYRLDKNSFEINTFDGFLYWQKFWYFKMHPNFHLNETTGLVSLHNNQNLTKSPSGFSLSENIEDKIAIIFINHLVKFGPLPHDSLTKLIDNCVPLRMDFLRHEEGEKCSVLKKHDNIFIDDIFLSLYVPPSENIFMNEDFFTRAENDPRNTEAYTTDSAIVDFILCIFNMLDGMTNHLHYEIFFTYLQLAKRRTKVLRQVPIISTLQLKELLKSSNDLSMDENDFICLRRESEERSLCQSKRTQVVEFLSECLRTYGPMHYIDLSLKLKEAPIHIGNYVHGTSRPQTYWYFKSNKSFVVDENTHYVSLQSGDNSWWCQLKGAERFIIKILINHLVVYDSLPVDELCDLIEKSTAIGKTFFVKYDIAQKIKFFNRHSDIFSLTDQVRLKFPLH